MLLLALFVEALIAFRRKPKNDQTIVLETRDLGQHRPGRSILQSPGRRLAGKSPIACKSPERMLARRKRLQSPEEGQPWVPDGSTVGPRFLGGNRGFPHKNRQPCVSLFYVIDTGSIGSRTRHHVTGWGLPIYPSP